MAGIAKPNVVGLGNELQITRVGFSGQTGDYYAKLFDGITGGGRTSLPYFGSPRHYLEFINNNDLINIWRSGSDEMYYGNLTIMKKQPDSTYVAVTSIYSLPTSPIKASWEMFIKKLPKGQYKLLRSNSVNTATVGENNNRVDSEWYIEDASKNKYIIQNTNNNLFRIIGGNIVDLGKIQPTESVFTSSGMDSLPYLTQDTIEKIGNCKILKWTNTGISNQTLTLQGEYKDKLIKLMPNWKLKMWTDDVNVTTAKVNCSTNPYRPIDKLDNDFKVLMYKE